MKKMFKNTTLTQKIILWFNYNNFKEVESRTGKYKVFTDTGDIYYFVGKSGGVRSNNKNVVSGSISITTTIKKQVLVWAKTQEQKTFVTI